MKMDITKKVQHFFSYWYTRYLVATELYMVEPWEKVVIHCLFGTLFLLFWWFNYSFVINSIGQLRSGSTQYTEQVQ